MNGPLEKVLSALEGTERRNGHHAARCPLPSHGLGRGDLNPSLSISEGDDERVLLRCRAGCRTEDVVEAAGLTMADLFPDNGERGRGNTYPSKNASTVQRSGVTVEEYAAHKKLPVEHLAEVCGVEQISYKGGPAVRMPYLDEEGRPVCTRFRVSLEGKTRVVTKKGAKHTLYGRWRLGNTGGGSYVVLVEGESDCHTLWYHEFPAIGVPGAKSWQSEWSEMLAGVDRVYDVVEPDGGGDALWDLLAASPVREKLYRVDLTVFGAKDPSELHLADPTGFREKMEAAMADAPSWTDIAETEGQEKLREAWRLCEHLAVEEDILERFAETMRNLNYAGDLNPAKILYLALVTRLLESHRFLVNVALKGPSSAGKSHTVETVLGFFPESAYVFRTATSEKVLAFGEDPLEHRFLVYAEADGMSGDVGALLIRSLLSEGRICYSYVEKSDGGLHEKVVEREGPTGLIVTTTRARLHPENETRLLSVRVDDSREQTKKILGMLAVEEFEEVDLAPWVAYQEWLGAGERRVTIPFARELVAEIPPVAVRLRRDVSTLLNLVRAHALLHRESRSRDDRGRIVATIAQDYAVARELVHDLMSENVEATVPVDVRETVGAVERLRGDSRENRPVSQAQLAACLKLDKGAVSHRVRKAIEAGYLENLEGRRGRPAKLVTAEPMPKDEDILPTVEALRRLTEGGPPPPPSDDVKAPAVGEPRALSPLAAALDGYLRSNPHRAHENASWLANALASEELVMGWPTVREAEEALGELRRAADQPGNGDAEVDDFTDEEMP